MEKKAKKKYSSKEIKAVIEMNAEKAAFTFKDKQKVRELLSAIEQYIANNETIIETFDDLKRHTSVIRDITEQNYSKLPPGYIVSVISIFIYLDTDVLQTYSLKTNKISREMLFAYIEKRYKKELKEYAEWEKWEKPGIYPVQPLFVIDSKEEDSMEVLNARYEKLIQPTIPSKVLNKAKDLLPENFQNQIMKIGNSISEQELYAKMIEIVGSGFDILVTNAAKVSLSEEYIVKQINHILKENHIFNLEQVCFARSYDIKKLVNSFKTRNIAAAFAEGGITGLPGIWGIPINLTSSMFIYYRAVQSIAMYYGYDVKNSAEELQIATDVFMQAFSPSTGTVSETGNMIVKFMSMSEALVIKGTIDGGWKAMADRGGICLALAQIRSLAHKSAEKVLEAAGKKGLEKSMFTSFFEQLGKKLTQSSIKKAATPAAALITAFADMSTMNKVIEFADIFYCKRFIAEKQIRIDSLTSPEMVKNVEYDVVTEELNFCNIE